MFARNLELKPAPAISTPSERLGEMARSYATVRLLEECTTACEMFAEELGDDPGALGIHGMLSECIAACGALLGAVVRESCYTARYALLCGEICESMAEACGQRLELASQCCEVLCRACANLVREEYAVAMAN